MNESLKSKLPDVGTTIFTVMSQLANECDAINLSQGFPAFDPPEALIERVAWHLRHGANQYAPMAGVPALGAAIAAKTQRLQGRTIDPVRHLTVTAGATEGLFVAIQALVHPGDEVVVLDPAYDSYEPAVELAGGTTRHVPLALDPESGEFSVDWERLAATLKPDTRLLVINFPHNPTGAILSADDLDQMAALLRDSNTLLLSDEVYEYLVFDDAQHISVAAHDELWQRSVVVCSFGKTYNATGWKIGYCLAPEAISAELRKVHQFATFAISTPMQCGIADFMQSDPEFPEALGRDYEQRRDRFCELLKNTRLRFTPTRSTFFQIVDYSEISDRLDVELAREWTRELGVASIPLSVFCEQPFTGTRLRLCFAKEEATLADAIERLATL